MIMWEVPIKHERHGKSAGCEFMEEPLYELTIQQHCETKQQLTDCVNVIFTK